MTIAVPEPLRGQVRVPLPPDEALVLFTPAGEELWVPGWRPRFASGTDSSAEAGAVFETFMDGELTLWVVVEAEPRRMSYARVTPGSRAGIVRVDVHPDGERGSVTEVVYQLSALSTDGAARLKSFAAGFQDMLTDWENAIAALLRRNPGAARTLVQRRPGRC